MQWLIFIFVITISYLVLRWVYQQYARSAIKERMLYGTNFEQAPTEEVNLMAADYGLAGSTLFFHHLTDFLASGKGYIAIFFIGAGSAWLISSLFKISVGSTNSTALLGGLFLLVITTVTLIRRERARKRAFKEELPSALQLVSAIMESGMGFESALNHVVEESDKKHPLYFELSIMNEAMQRGRRRGEALKLWADRSKEDSVIETASSLIQAEQTGGSFGTVLKHHAIRLMQDNEAEMMRNAERLPVKMLIPMVLCTLIPLLLVAAGPAFITIFKMFKDIMGKA
jgi:tight adherence protein C